MDNALLVDELRKVLRGVRKEKGHVALFMLTITDNEATGTWNLIASATGYDRIQVKEAVSHLLKAVLENVSEEHLASLTRLTVLRTSDEFVKGMNRAFSVKDSMVRIQSSTFFGIYIESAILLESQRPPKKSKHKEPRKNERKNE